MNVMELNGTHIPLKVRVSWKLRRKNAKLHEYEGYLYKVIHNSPDYVWVVLTKSCGQYYYWNVVHDDTVPFWADVEILE